MGAENLKQYTPEYISQKLEDLPTLPSIVYELTKIINDPLSSTNEVEKVMSQDQSLTTKVLKLANSAYYAIPGGVTKLSKAIGYIGYDTVNQLVLAASIIDALEVDSCEGFDIKQFWQHSLGVGMAAECLAKAVNHKSPSDCFTCGIVHDMGKVAMLIIVPDLVRIPAEHARQHHSSFEEAERVLALPKHTQVGQVLAEKWNLPSGIQNAILLHHEKDINKRMHLSQEMNQTVDIVYLANLLIHALKFGNSGHGKVVGVPKSVLDRLNLDQANLKKAIGEIKGKISNSTAFLNTILGSDGER